MCLIVYLILIWQHCFAFAFYAGSYMVCRIRSLYIFCIFSEIQIWDLQCSDLYNFWQKYFNFTVSTLKLKWLTTAELCDHTLLWSRKPCTTGWALKLLSCIKGKGKVNHATQERRRIKEQLANPGSPWIMTFKTECVCMCGCDLFFQLCLLFDLFHSTGYFFKFDTCLL